MKAPCLLKLSYSLSYLRYGIFTSQGVVSETNNTLYVRFAINFIFYLYKGGVKGIVLFSSFVSTHRANMTFLDFKMDISQF